MDAQQCVAFLEAIRAKKIRIKDNGWVEASCPLAPWLHKHAKDNSPSFGLSISPGERSYYSCFACQSGSVEELLHTLQMYLQDRPEKADIQWNVCHQLLSDEVQLLPLPEYAEHGQSGQKFEEWPLYWLQSFVPVDMIQPAMEYLHFREVGATTIKQFNLRFDSKRHMIVAPYWDVYGRFAGARGRSIQSDVSGAQKHFDYSWQGRNNARLVWYNETALNLSGPTVVVEGQFDCWRVVQAFPKTVANLTAKPTREKLRKLGDSPFIIQIPDRDETGELSVSVYKKACQELGIGHKVVWLDEGVKDPAECHPDYLKDKISGVL